MVSCADCQTWTSGVSRMLNNSGKSADFWMNLQLRWDLYHTQQAESEDLNAIRPQLLGSHAPGTEEI